jgi:CRP-like cAMP-binding protein
LFIRCAGQPEFELVVKAFQRQEFPPGATIVQEGTLGDSCYVVESGAARMCEAQGRTLTLASGSIFGDMGLMDEWIHTASVLVRFLVTYASALFRKPTTRKACSRCDCIVAVVNNGQADTDVMVWSLSGEAYRKTLAAYSVKQ